MKAVFKVVVQTVVLVFAVSSMSFSNDANAYQGFFDKEKVVKKEHRQFKRMAKHLSLTKEQKQQVKSLNMQDKTERASMKEKMKSYKKEVKTLMQAEYFDEQAFLTLHNSNQETFAQAAMLRAKHKHQMMKILTPEQQKKAKRMKGKMQAKFQQR